MAPPPAPGPEQDPHRPTREALGSAACDTHVLRGRRWPIMRPRELHEASRAVPAASCVRGLHDVLHELMLVGADSSLTQPPSRSSHSNEHHFSVHLNARGVRGVGRVTDVLRMGLWPGPGKAKSLRTPLRLGSRSAPFHGVTLVRSPGQRLT